MTTERLTELLAIALIGDGVIAVLEPRRHSLLWKSGPRMWEEFINPFVERPGMARLVGAAQIGLGIWLASKQKAR